MCWEHPVSEKHIPQPQWPGRFFLLQSHWGRTASKGTSLEVACFYPFMAGLPREEQDPSVMSLSYL